MQRQMVIARYREDLNWLTGYHDWNIHLYDKSQNSDHGPRASLPANAEVTRLFNIGREAHTYLTHIVDHYDRLAGVTVFVQGSPLDHVSHLRNRLDELPQDPGFRELGHTPIADDAFGNPSHANLNVAALYRALFSAEPPQFYPFHAGANFAVSRATIRRRPREFYRRALTEVLQSEAGPWEVERLWPTIFQPPTRRAGIVTAATPDIFFDLRQMLTSLERFERCSVEVFDLGLTDRQRAWITGHPNRFVRKLPRLVNRVSRLQRVREWPTWLKPYYLLHSHFDRVLWIDADCVVLRDPSAAFDIIRQRPLIMSDVSAACVRNHPALYHDLPVPRVDASLRLNAGVVGLDRHRDSDLLGAWAWAVQWAARNLRLRNRLRWFDQGALLWSLQRVSMASSIQQDLTWNTPWLTDENPVRQAADSGISLPELLQRQLPEAGIVHFLGDQKLSEMCERLIRGKLGKPGSLTDFVLPP